MNKVKLICLPFAGGSSYSYNGFKRWSKNIDIIQIELPGRGTRVNDPLLKDARQMAHDALTQITKSLNGPYALYGHSMGALVAYLITKEIILKGVKQPAHLYFSGSNGPSHRRTQPRRFDLPPEQFIKMLKDMDDRQNDVYDDEDVMSLFEPILRADFEAVETYTHAESQPFDIPITCMIGTEEQIDYAHALSTWTRETTAPVVMKQFPGKHFFIYHHEDDIIKSIEQDLSSLL